MSTAEKYQLLLKHSEALAELLTIKMGKKDGRRGNYYLTEDEKRLADKTISAIDRMSREHKSIEAKQKELFS
jgi:hypothetical protein